MPMRTHSFHNSDSYLVTITHNRSYITRPIQSNFTPVYPLFSEMQNIFRCRCILQKAVRKFFVFVVTVARLNKNDVSVLCISCNCYKCYV